MEGCCGLFIGNKYGVLFIALLALQYNTVTIFIYYLLKYL
jgi:hypothetical protein